MKDILRTSEGRLHISLKRENAQALPESNIEVLVASWGEKGQELILQGLKLRQEDRLDKVAKHRELLESYMSTGYPATEEEEEFIRGRIKQEQLIVSVWSNPDKVLRKAKKIYTSLAKEQE